MTRQAFRARLVCPVAAPPIEDAIVVLEGDRIQRIGRQAPADIEVEDLGDVALMPGFVNAHCHLEFSGQRRPIGRTGIALPDWIRQVIEKRPNAKKIGKAIADGMDESLRYGVTTIAEICRTETEAYRTTGYSPRLVLLQESIGFSQARAQSALNAAENRLEELSTLTRPSDAAGNGHAAALNGHGANGHANGYAANGHASNGHANGVATINGYATKPNPRIRIGVSPHAPYTASPQLIRELVSVAATRQMPVAMHLAESPEELQLLAEGRGPFQKILEERGMWDPWVIGRGSAPLDYLRMLTRAPKSLVVHGNYLDYSELAMMARQAGAMSLCYCPRSHAHFKHSPYPLTQALELGVPVCLGTDSRASSPDLSLLSEMREVAARHPGVPAETILRMGTLAGAEALGLEDVGAIRPGAMADLVCVPLPKKAKGRPDELLAAMLNSDEDVEYVWLGGEALEVVAA
ncbi:Aminodeoxyfutalosine deaminase [Botrimarina colliarenosi]|uniref:Aminodeoxyfutalosine deaminase n=1 Tax=Botrimarina colliarenosi TaxID=2528001 RepID=A0A5C6AF49_9BACT|nr:amidohydrolase family protein [Botrimarina colliarenosi]TWT98047.1 Aminodeoxyfutalosine deaminase [Botrimarina colliarenosi]